MQAMDKDIMETELASLLAMIRGSNSSFMSIGICSYPLHDSNNRRIHTGCLVLEERGLIYRKHEETDYILWMPK